jgi:hypothetical protein
MEPGNDRKSFRTARSRPRGLSFPEAGQAIFPGCAARAVLKVTLEKDPTDGWIIGLNDVTTLMNTEKLNPDRDFEVAQRTNGFHALVARTGMTSSGLLDLKGIQGGYSPSDFLGQGAREDTDCSSVPVAITT